MAYRLGPGQYVIGPTPGIERGSPGGALINLGLFAAPVPAVNPTGNCQLGETLIPEGPTIIAYKRTSADDCDAGGNSEQRTCTYGVLSGHLRNLSCEEPPPEDSAETAE